MFERSPLSNNMLLRPDLFSRGEHLLADGAYTLTDKVMFPYKTDRNNTPRQRLHNTVLSSARASIERSFARLKGKTRRLKKLPMKNISYMIDHITSGFVLHNFIILEGQEADGLPEQEMPLAENVGHRNDLMEKAKALGAIKRDYIAQLIHP